MSDLSLALAAHAHTTMLRAQDGARSQIQRLQDEEGQTSAEYVGLILIVAAIIAALIKLKVPERIGTAVDGALNKIGV